jgi:outer membrane cobalamin receptor
VCFLSLAFLFTARSAAAAEISGIIVDQSGQPLPRAVVRIVDPSGSERLSVFTDQSGRFEANASAPCRIEAALTGFRPAAVPCSAAGPVRVVLAVAPVEETVVVTATRTNTPTAAVAASVTTFSAEELQRRRAALVADLLRTTPGAMLITSGAPGGVTSLFVRGGESSYNKVLLDGIPINEPGGTFNFNDVSTDGFDRIEVVRGANSALFGSDAVSSVVQLFTRHAAAGTTPHGWAAVEGGTFATLHASAGVSGSAGPHGRIDYALSVGRQTTDNDAPNNAFENTTVTANSGVALGAAASLRVVVRTEGGRTGTPGQTAFGRADSDAFFDRHDTVAGVTFAQPLTTRLHHQASYSIAASHQQSADFLVDPPYTPSFGANAAPFEFSDFPFDSRTRLRRHHASYQVDWQAGASATRGAHLITVLADFDGERATLKDQLADQVTAASRNNLGWSMQDQAAWRRVFVTAGLRVEHNDSFGAAVAPRVSAVVVAARGSRALGETRLRASAGRGIKEPTVLQSFSPSPFFEGNPDLEPERSRSLEAGVEQRLAADRARVELTFFDNRFTNLISTRTLSVNPYHAQYFNIGRTTARGVELTADTALAHGIRIKTGYTFLASRIVDSTSPFDVVFQPGNWLFRRPRHAGFLDVAWSWRGASADVSGVFVGRYVDSDFSSLEPALVANPGYGVVNARVAAPVGSRLSVLLSIDNVADRAYQEPLGYPALGRAMRVGARVAF